MCIMCTGYRNITFKNFINVWYLTERVRILGTLMWTVSKSMYIFLCKIECVNLQSFLSWFFRDPIKAAELAFEKVSRTSKIISLIWKKFSFSHVSYLCLKVLYLERNFSRCTHQAHTVFYFQLWGIFKSAFFDQKSHMCLMCAHTFFSFEGMIRQYHMYILV